MVSPRHLGLLLMCCLALAARDARSDEHMMDAFVSRHCIECHDSASLSGGLDLEAGLARNVTDDSQMWEKVLRQINSRQMPPLGRARPSEEVYDLAASTLSRALDRQYQLHPKPGRTETLRRLTRTEYQNAIRDLLSLNIDVSAFLPPDESSHGFDNITVTDLTPTLVDRYITLAETISRMVAGGAELEPQGTTVRIRPDLTQARHLPGLPLGTRGGALVRHTFPQSGAYEVRIRLARDRNEEIEGLRGSHELEILLDRQHRQSLTIKPPSRGGGHQLVDANLVVRIPVTAGEHHLGVTFIKKSSSLLETKRQPYHAQFNMHRHPRQSPAVYQISITGPFSNSNAGSARLRLRGLSCPQTSREHHHTEQCAIKILKPIMRLAYRRPVGMDDLQEPLRFFGDGMKLSGFDKGIELALSSILINPNFVFRIESDQRPSGSETDVVKVADLALASRLAFFLWSSLPDDELLSLAEQNRLREPEIFDAQVRRMLGDPKSGSLVSSFADQWLYLRNLDSITPNLRLFPDFDDNLRQAMKLETSMFFEDMIREDRSVLGLLEANYTYLNERLARHYEIPHVIGSRFRRVHLTPDNHRGGLLRHASILTVTSYATRTSPVIRGHWILKNLLGTPPPPAPPDVPALDDNSISSELSMRERLAEHRSNKACARCHNLMDPVGFSLENFDAVGRWRSTESGEPVDVSGGLPDGSEFVGVEGLEAGLLRRPKLFVGTMVEKLMTFALGRGLNLNDAPAVRKIVRDAEREEFRFSALIAGIARSVPFRMREVR